ncbi:type II toxin-antitoxin system RelE/ParE family toxin [Candidatus Fukatsuia symbiotica]|uniref:Addiction module toxin RelE n=1 Tax=Candidatus Fukatsuia symbiotica TaxID=1878942 RepID=A0A2U8I6F6_9GAMM|nr:type II toxin-antitoxin system RelE/ParE family toxin [Candidatus Fukatsuia symbiotica]AWK14732.1 addiction module toxin RelE [Candidatus Fukatsuia symbiotica]MEA9445062.1 type II toxin-antitoxin system RelE/ParE family toxin [Candidatus Fukatsuia symbiotica]
MNAKTEKSLVWIGSSKKDLLELPQDIVKSVGYTLHFAQKGLTPPNVKPLSGFHGAGVLEVVENYDGNTYRAICTVKFASVVFVLHCFQKKSKKGIATPRADLDLIRTRLNTAQQIYEDMKNGKI